MSKKRIVTGYRPTGKMHIGHWFGNMLNMIELQEETEAFYFIADYHALTSDWEDTKNLGQYTREMVLDWCAAGLDPDRCTIYRQSDVPEVAELMLFLAMVTPMPWLERVPSYKDQKAQIDSKDLGNVGFFLYPELMAADIVLMLAEAVPVGEDQLPHLELTREIVRRFNNTYGQYLKEPAAHLSGEGARVLGSDGRKMSKSFGNAIFVSDSKEEIEKKARGFMTDPARKLLSDPGDPEVCPLHQVHKLVGAPEDIAKWEKCCKEASCGCVKHKMAFAEDLNSYFEEFRARREVLANTPGFVEEVLEKGAKRAQPIAAKTIATLRELMGISPETQLSASVSREKVEADGSALSYLENE